MPPTNNVWASNTPSSLGEQRTLPSGQTCHARKLQMEDLIEMGIVEQADSLTSLVDANHVRKVRGGKGADRNEVDLRSVMKDSGALKSMITLADKAIPHIVLDPPVQLHYVATESGQRMLSEEDRKKIRADVPDVVFTDQIDMADKFELFNWAMGSLGGLESFRDKSASDAVAVVADGSSVPRKTKRARGANTR